MTTRVLHVCVLNLCRSVLAERLMRHGLSQRLGDGADRFAVGSAGTAARPERSMHPLVAEVLQRRGADTAGFATKRLDGRLVEAADLVLAATVAERDAVLAMDAAALNKTFTLHEFARLASHVDRGDPDCLAEHARELRGRLPYVDPATLDVPDPAPTAAAFEACAQQIEWSLDMILDAICHEVRLCAHRGSS